MYNSVNEARNFQGSRTRVMYPGDFFFEGAETPIGGKSMHSYRDFSDRVSCT